MKRRSKAGGEPIKGRRRKTPEPERRSAPKRVSSSTPSATLGLEKGILQNAPFAPYKYRRTSHSNYNEIMQRFVVRDFSEHARHLRELAELRDSYSS